MTLARQLYWVLIVLLLATFLGTFTISLHDTQDFLEKQLASTAQDTATSLGLSVSTSLAQKDSATVQSMVDAVFDRGYYQLIRVEDTGGQTVYERTKPIIIDRMPGWFVELFTLDVPTADAEIMSGWLQAGTLRVSSHPGYAYEQLWRSASFNLIWFAACTALALLLGGLLVRRLLKPLRAVESQALAICNREYPIETQLPWTSELRRVTEAMNRMSAKVGQMFQEQAALAEQLQKNAFVDPLTGLGNRNALDTQLEYLLYSPDEFTESTLLLIRIMDFKEYNQKHGYMAGDTLLLWVAAALWEAASGQARLACRLSGADFAVLTRSQDREENTRLAKQIMAELVQMHEDGIIDTAEIAHIGLAPCASGQSPGDVLANADLALRQARQLGPNQFQWAEGPGDGQNDLGGAQQWRDQLSRYLDGNAFLLHTQPVADTRQPGNWLNHEVRLRAREADGSLVLAGSFMAMAERAGLAQAIDRRVVELSAQLLERPGFNKIPLVINLTSASINDPAFASWLVDYLKTREIGPQIIFEVAEHNTVRHLGSLKTLAPLLKSCGSLLAISNFGSRLTSFGYLRDIPVSYAKLDGSYSRDLAHHKENQVFVRAMVTMAHDLDIKIIAESVETEEEARILTELNVDGLQGYHLGRPADPLDGPPEH